MGELSNYELLDLVATYAGEAGSHFMNFVTIFSAYIVAGYMLAERISKPTLILFSALYTAVVLMPASASFMVLLLAIDLGAELGSRQAVLGENVSLVVALLSGKSGLFLKYSNPILQLLAYLGSITFVFRSRSQKLANARAAASGNDA